MKVFQNTQKPASMKTFQLTKSVQKNQHTMNTNGNGL